MKKLLKTFLDLVDGLVPTMLGEYILSFKCFKDNNNSKRNNFKITIIAIVVIAIVCFIFLVAIAEILRKYKNI